MSSQGVGSEEETPGVPDAKSYIYDVTAGVCPEFPDLSFSREYFEGIESSHEDPLVGVEPSINPSGSHSIGRVYKRHGEPAGRGKPHHDDGQAPAFEAVVALIHLKMKFLTRYGIGEIQGSQKKARGCYLASTKWIKAQMEAGSTGEPRDCNICTLQVPEEAPRRGGHMWTFEVSHLMRRNRKRTFSEEKGEAIREEVDKLLGANAIQELFFPIWLDKVVLVPNPNGTSDVYGLQQHQEGLPKRLLPLPNIDRLVDSSAGYKVVGFLDAFRGYNYILMAEEDVEKTAFVIECDIYYWQVMAFGLKYVGPTYQRMVNKMFSTQINRNMEIYVDDILIKIREADDPEANLRENFDNLRRYKLWLKPDKCVQRNHEANLHESFDNLRRYKLWLNPDKCLQRKFLGYMIS
ncbi:hypothetical protein LIER_22915 [Lithospermum erythrorhizon]|uniref:Reverse transcriptase domain-containing protein n=1 Tax=Lithospermum erythrorhizon TaxID=34254 RepID=A0AAV3QWU9_LITER